MHCASGAANQRPSDGAIKPLCAARILSCAISAWFAYLCLVDRGVLFHFAFLLAHNPAHTFASRTTGECRMKKKSLQTRGAESGHLSRRSLMKGVGSTVTLGGLASIFGAMLPAGVDAAASAAGVDCMTILYPAGAGVTFDADYYRDHHLVTIMRLYGQSISRFELRKVAATPAGAPAVAYSAAVNIWIADLKAFGAANAKHGKTLVDDVPHFTNSQPSIQFDKIHGEMGKGRGTPKIGDTCLTILYKNGDEVRWDVEYYRTHHMPTIMKLYGPDAISRFELRKGDSGQAPGSNPAFIGSVGIYINQQAAFDAAGKQHGATLVKDVPNFSSVMPIAFPTIIYGIG
jgi:uncharacterized protein (TIGR02118 family)